MYVKSYKDNQFNEKIKINQNKLKCMYDIKYMKCKWFRSVQITLFRKFAKLSLYKHSIKNNSQSAPRKLHIPKVTRFCDKVKIVKK